MVMPGPSASKVHKLILFRCKARAIAPSPPITLGMGLGKPPAVVLSGFSPGYQCDIIHKPYAPHPTMRVGAPLKQFRVIEKENKMGERGEPWGMPVITGNAGDSCPSNARVVHRSDMKEKTQL